MERKKSGPSFRRFWLPLFLFAVAVIVFYKVVDRLPSVFSAIMGFIGILSPFIVGIVIAFILYRPANRLEGWLQKHGNRFFKGHARGFSVLICYAVLLLILAALLYFILPRLWNSVASLVNNIPGYYSSLMSYVDSLAGSDGRIMGFDISSFKEQFTLSAVLSYFDFATISKYAGEIFKATGVVVDFFFALVVSVYVLLSHEHLIRVCGKLLGMVLPERKVRRLHGFLVRSSEIFYSYIYSQMLDAVIVTVLCLIVFSIARLPYAFLLAVLMGICNLIPYFGAWIGGAGVVFVTLISTGNIVQAIVALVCVIGAQQLDANVLQPKIVADSVGLRPIYVLLAITVGSGLFGLLGILLSVPVMAIIRMLIVDYIRHLGDEDTPLVKKQDELSAEKAAEEARKKELEQEEKSV